MSGTIKVKGVGTAKTKPDYVEVMLNLSGKNADYAAAVNQANEKIEKLKDAISKVGYDKDDLKTLNFSANTNYEYEHGKQQLKGYICKYRLKLGFDFTAEALAKTLTAIANSGADAEFSVGFSVKEPEKVAEELLISAAENARQKADILCKASGKTLGELVSVDYDWGEIKMYSESNYALAAAPRAMDMAPEFTPDDINSSDTVTFVWTII